MNLISSFFLYMVVGYLLIPLKASAEIKLPSIFGDGMVLQQDTDVKFWGSATAYCKVVITPSWDHKKYTAQADTKGNWCIYLKTPKAIKNSGIDYEITINENNGDKLILGHVLIGEVWLCSGQSNMEMVMKGYRNQPVKGSMEAIVNSSNSNIRLFTVEKEMSLQPLDTLKGGWSMCKPASVAEFSATAYYFGKKLNDVLGVPIGIIHASWGGTAIQTWMGRDALKQFDWVSLPQDDVIKKMNPNTPSVLFNGMIHPIIGFGIRGVIWYQGETNRMEPDEYQELLPGLIESWRTLWGEGEFPFYYVQIAPHEYGPKVNSAFLREAQLTVASALPNVGMACIMDIGEAQRIHPMDKETGGDRLAYLALEHTYTIQGINGDSPVFKDMATEGALIKLTFDNAPDGLTSFGKELLNFEVAGKNKRFFPARADIVRDGVMVFSAQVPDPVAVRYAFKNFVVGDLYGTNGLPVSSFRSDDW